MAPILPQLKAEFGISYGAVGLVVSAFGLSRLIFDLPVGWAAERFKPIMVLSLGTFLITAGSLSAALSSSYTGLVASRAIMGAGSAMCATTALIVIAHLSTPQNRARMLSMFPVAAYAGTSFAPLISGYLAAIFDWRASFFFCAITTFISFAFVMITQRKRQEPNEAGHGQSNVHHHRQNSKPGALGLSSAATSRALIAAMLAAVAIYFSRQGLIQALVPLYAGNALRVNVETIGTLLSGSAIISMVILSLSGILADRYGRMLVFIPGVSSLILGALMLPFSSNLMLLVVCTGLLSLGGMTVSIPGVYIGDLSSRTTLTRNMGLLRFLSDFGIFAGPVTLSSMVDYFGYNVPAIADAAFLVISAASVLLLMPFGSSPQRVVVQARETGEVE